MVKLCFRKLEEVSVTVTNREIVLGDSIKSVVKENSTDENINNEIELVDYPPQLVELLEKNPETYDFVAGYAEQKDIHHDIDVSGEVEKGTIPLFLQWDNRWGYEKYGDDMLALTGCGPTCLSMVRCGLSGDSQWHPLAVAQVAEQNGFYTSGAGSAWTLMSDGAGLIGLKVHKVSFDEESILYKLKRGYPIICIMGPGDFTEQGHFIVLTGVDKNGNITICDPNSRIRSEQTWELSRLMSQIRNLWAYSYIQE